MSIIETIQEFIHFLISLGDLGIFLISLLGSAIPFFPLPYLLLVILEARNRDFLGLIILGIIAGAGGAIGKITSYYLGRGARFALSEESKKELEFLSKIARKYGAIAIFIFAVSPLPDDALYFPLGVMKFDIKVFLIINALGKIMLSTLVAFLSGIYYNVIGIFFGETDWISPLMAISFALILTLVLLRIKWSLVFAILEKEGIKGILKNLRKIIR